MSEPANTDQSERMAAARAARAAAAPVVETADALVPTPVADSLPAGPSVLQRAAANEEEQRVAKIAALRAARAHGVDVAAEPQVTVRVLKRGHGLVSMGEHISGLGELTYDAGETPSFPQSIAQALEDKGLVEIQ